KPSLQQSSSSRTTKPPNNVAESSIPIALQQSLLDIFRNAFGSRFQPDFSPAVQEVKQHLFHRDFTSAFSRQELLDVYCGRWSPSRALGYLQILEELNEVKDLLVGESSDTNERTDCKSTGARRACLLGGGAGAEIVAFAGLLHLLRQRRSESVPSLHLHTIDVADWGTIVATLADRISTPPPLSAYASAAARERAVPLVPPDSVTVSFRQADLLSADTPIGEILSQDNGAAYDVRTTIGRDTGPVTIVTLMFTLNELYSTNVPRTQSFLLRLGHVLEPGALLLVVDSPGSYANVAINSGQDSGKKYPMRWLLDLALLEEGNTKDRLGESSTQRWKKIREEESAWFRMPGSLEYPIELENMRYQLHLYR
ncbi:hypothetical protein BDY21DRAFT_257653, partial [Lineolata rhizophorae]